MKPRLFLDVDGVINASPNLDQPRMADEWPDFCEVRINRLGVIYSPTVIRWICSLITEDRVEVLWLTTWNEEARSWLSPAVGLPDFPLAGDRKEPLNDFHWWKLSVVDFWNRTDPAPYIWIDDEIGWTAEAVVYLEQDETDHCIISPYDRTGITASHIDQVEAFLARDAPVASE